MANCSHTDSRLTPNHSGNPIGLRLIKSAAGQHTWLRRKIFSHGKGPYALEADGK